MISFLPLLPTTWTPNALEVSAVFDWPLQAFLHENHLPSGGGGGGDERWYEGYWTMWHDQKWRMHKFYVPALDPASRTTHMVWGMTARILVDAARIAYAREPEFEHALGYGDEELMETLVETGVMGRDEGEGVGVLEGGAESREEAEEQEDLRRRTTATPAKM
jgi:hypothetical protein